ncbi:MAG: HNH endonuclease, partial [Bacillota bacterium]|nr:HNH endonuclease [Bacillota bacterium]
PNYQKLQRFLIHPIDSINEVVLRKQQMKLENYRSYLDFSNPERRCLFCQKQIIDEPAIHYVIPHFFLQTDDLWNLVYTHDDCHEAYLEVLPEWEIIKRLERRNLQLLQQLGEWEVNDKAVREITFAVNCHLPASYWQKYQGMLYH